MGGGEPACTPDSNQRVSPTCGLTTKCRLTCGNTLTLFDNASPRFPSCCDQNATKTEVGSQGSVGSPCSPGGRGVLEDQLRTALAKERSDLLFRRARPVITEMERTRDGARALRAHDYRALGELLDASHRSTAVDYEVSGEELDVITAAARECDGVFGSRLAMP